MGSREVNVLTGRQKSILIGKILGDGTLEKNGRYTRLKIAHTDKQREYVLWVYREFKNFATQKPKFVWSGSRYGKVGQFRFSTYSLPIFDHYRGIFYQGRKKIVPKTIVDLLKDPLSLAVWYMDDGYKRTDNSGLYLCTSAFTNREHSLLQNCLSKNFGIETNIHYAGGYARLHIPSRCKYMFCDQIRQFVIPSLEYKLL